jgi:hypothetical protein
MPRCRSHLLLIGTVWIATIGSGFFLVVGYDTQPGPPGKAPIVWPESSRLSRARGSATLLMFVHPRCPCSRAGIEQLRRIVESAAQPLAVQVLFVAPPGAPEDWQRTALWQAADSIPGATLQADVDSAEARRFGVTTSGHTLLYDVQGRLEFEGGVTAARGHYGDSSSSESLLALLSSGAPESRSTPTFGCPLSAPCK